MRNYMILESTIDGLINCILTVRDKMKCMNQMETYLKYGDKMVDEFENRRPVDYRNKFKAS